MSDNLIPPSHIGDGLYMKDNGYQVAIAVNHHENDVAFVIQCLKRVKNRINNNQNK
jgi:hypothetical protein